MPSSDEVIGQQAALGLLGRMLASGRVPQALLFHGPEAVGKATVAMSFAAALLCESGAQPACGQCAACKMVRRRAHPDVLWVERLPKTEPSNAGSEDDEPDSAGDLRKFILIEQIRELSRIAALTPRLARRRVFLIDPADRMNLEAQNALLKTLEEPPGHALLILVASRPHLLLPTVRSRCFAVAFAALRAQELARSLEQRGLAAGEAAARAALAAGRPGLALTLDLGAQHERRERILRAVESLAADPPAISELPALAAELAGKDEELLVESLQWVQGLLRDAARAAMNPSDPALLHADLADRLARLGGRLGSVRAAGIVRSVDRLRDGLRYNTNRVLVAEALLAGIAGGPIP